MSRRAAVPSPDPRRWTRRAFKDPDAAAMTDQVLRTPCEAAMAIPVLRARVAQWLRDEDGSRILTLEVRLKRRDPVRLATFHRAKREVSGATLVVALDGVTGNVLSARQPSGGRS